MDARQVKQRLFDLGADLCGIAGNDRFGDAPQGYHPLDVLPTCQSVIVSAKHAAQAAGLGTIGRHSLLITPEYGSMVWLSVILTEAELEEDSLQESVCNNCNRCVDICPVQALEAEEINQSACWDYAFGEVKQDWRISCHKCRDVCPFLFGSENKQFQRKLE